MARISVKSEKPLEYARRMKRARTVSVTGFLHWVSLEKPAAVRRIYRCLTSTSTLFCLLATTPCRTLRASSQNQYHSCCVLLFTPTVCCCSCLKFLNWKLHQQLPSNIGGCIDSHVHDAEVAISSKFQSNRKEFTPALFRNRL